MQLLPCPQCKQILSVPDHLASETTLKCPNCEESDSLGHLRQSSLPSWEIVGEPIWESPPESTESSAAGLSSAGVETDDQLPSQEDGQEYSLVPDEPKRLPPQPRLSASEARRQKKSNRKADWSNFKPITHEEYERRKRATKSPIWSAVQIGLGGVAAVPIALLIIWHILHKDIGGAGPIVAQYVPWIVPAEFRPIPAIQSDQDLANSSKSSRSSGRGGTGKFRNFDDVMPPDKMPTSAEVMTEDPTITEDPTAIAKRSDKEIVEPAPTDIDPNSDSDNKEMKVESTDANIENNAIPSVASEGAIPPALEISGDSLGGAVIKARDAIEAWDKYEGTDQNQRRTLAANYYDSLSNLANRLGAPDVDLQSPLQRTWKKQIDVLFKKIASNDELRKLAAFGCRAKLQASDIPENLGIATYGKVTAIDDSGDPLRFQLDASAGISTWEFQCSEVVAEQLNLAVDQPYLIFGQVVEPYVIQCRFIQPAAEN